MKKLSVLMVSIIFISFIYSCGPNAKELEQKRIADSTSVADSMTKIQSEQQRIADSTSVADSIKNAIDHYVDSIFSNEHNVLEQPIPLSQENNLPYSVDEIFNNTEYNLTIRYSGSESKIIILYPGEKKNIKLTKGRYRETASVNASNVMDYAGTSFYNTDKYSEEFYIH